MSKIVLVIFRVFNRNRREHLKLSYLAIFLFVIILLKFQIKDGFSFNITSLQKCWTNEFLYLETVTSCHYVIIHSLKFSLFRYYLSKMQRL